MTSQEPKIIVEAALLTAEQPLSFADLRRVLNDELNADHVRALLVQLQGEWAGRGLNRSRSLPMALPKHPAMRPYLDRLSGAATEIFTGGA